MSDQAKYEYDDGKRKRLPNRSCAVARAGGKACDPSGGDPSQRCGPCREYVRKADERDRKR